MSSTSALQSDFNLRTHVSSLCKVGKFKKNAANIFSRIKYWVVRHRVSLWDCRHNIGIWLAYIFWFNFPSILRSGIAFLHSKQICHRDIKPQNAMLSGEWRPVSDIHVLTTFYMPFAYRWHILHFPHVSTTFYRVSPSQQATAIISSSFRLRFCQVLRRLRCKDSDLTTLQVDVLICHDQRIFRIVWTQ